MSGSLKACWARRTDRNGHPSSSETCSGLCGLNGDNPSLILAPWRDMERGAVRETCMTGHQNRRKACKHDVPGGLVRTTYVLPRPSLSPSSSSPSSPAPTGSCPTSRLCPTVSDEIDPGRNVGDHQLMRNELPDRVLTKISSLRSELPAASSARVERFFSFFRRLLPPPISGC